jgi:hypothetical protein
MKKAFKIIGGLFAAFIAVVVIMLVVDINNDVEYDVVKEEIEEKTIHLEVSTEEDSKEKIKEIADAVQKKYEEEGKEIVFLHINKDEKLIAMVDIPYNDAGMIRAGTDDLDYVIQYK